MPARVGRIVGQGGDKEGQFIEKAHAFAYGNCIIQEVGYYPFGSHYFSDLVHSVRSAISYSL